LSLGVDPKELGPEVSDWVRLGWPEPLIGKSTVRGEIVFVDHFGNLITNIPASAILRPPAILMLGKRSIRRRFRWVRTYAEAKPGSVVALVCSGDTVEIAVVQGSAAKKLRAGADTPVTLGWPR